MEKYLKKITQNGRVLYLAYDHGLEHGPRDFNETTLDPNYILDLALKGRTTGIILQGGLAQEYYYKSKYQSRLPLILKINGKTNLYQTKNPYSAVTYDILDAKKIGASAIGYTLYLGSAFEAKMMEEFSRLRFKAHQLNMAAILWVYPRGEFIADETSEEVTAYAGRVGLELGADMIKIKYCGSENGFRKAVKAAGKTKVVLSGGPKTESEDFLATVKSVMKAGAIGAAVGRNIWQSKEPEKALLAIREIIFGNL